MRWWKQYMPPKLISTRQNDNRIHADSRTTKRQAWILHKQINNSMKHLQSTMKLHQTSKVTNNSQHLSPVKEHIIPFRILASHHNTWNTGLDTVGKNRRWCYGFSPTIVLNFHKNGQISSTVHHSPLPAVLVYSFSSSSSSFELIRKYRSSYKSLSLDTTRIQSRRLFFFKYFLVKYFR